MRKLLDDFHILIFLLCIYEKHTILHINVWLPLFFRIHKNFVFNPLLIRSEIPFKYKSWKRPIELNDVITYEETTVRKVVSIHSLFCIFTILILFTSFIFCCYVFFMMTKDAINDSNWGEFWWMIIGVFSLPICIITNIYVYAYRKFMRPHNIEDIDYFL